MKNFHPLNPYLLFTVAVTAFIGWIVYDATRLRSRSVEPGFAESQLQNPAVQSRIRPGMSRTEVEARLKPLLGDAPGEVSAVDLSAGFAAYRVRYRLGTDRSQHSTPAASVTLRGQELVVTYDAHTTGHPLLYFVLSPDGNGEAAAVSTSF